MELRSDVLFVVVVEIKDHTERRRTDFTKIHSDGKKSGQVVKNIVIEARAYIE